MWILGMSKPQQNPVDSVDELCELISLTYPHKDCDNSCSQFGEYEKAKTALYNRMIELLPEEQRRMGWNGELGKNNGAWNSGFNEAVKLMKAALDKEFKG